MATEKRHPPLPTDNRPRSFREIVDAVEQRRKQVTVYAPTLPRWLSEAVGDSHVRIAHRSLPEDRMDPFVTVRAGDTYLGSVRLAALSSLTDAEIWPPGDPRHLDEENARFRDMLADTVFSSLDRRTLVATAREIEDRAWRISEGTLYASFQSLSALRDQMDVYSVLSWRENLAVHVYGRPDWDPPSSIPGLHVHETDDERVTGYWVVAYDGGGDDGQKCALVAEQLGPAAYAGFWTYDPAIVDDVVAVLRDVSPRTRRDHEST